MRGPQRRQWALVCLSLRFGVADLGLLVPGADSARRLIGHVRGAETEDGGNHMHGQLHVMRPPFGSFNAGVRTNLRPLLRRTVWLRVHGR